MEHCVRYGSCGVVPSTKIESEPDRRFRVESIVAVFIVQELSNGDLAELCQREGTGDVLCPLAPFEEFAYPLIILLDPLVRVSEVVYVRPDVLAHDGIIPRANAEQVGVRTHMFVHRLSDRGVG